MFYFCYKKNHKAKTKFLQSWCRCQCQCLYLDVDAEVFKWPKKTLYYGWWKAYPQLLVIIYLWITISHLLVCFSHLFELATFEQQVCSTKISYAYALSFGTNSCNKRNVATLNSAHRAKKHWNFDNGWLKQQQLNQFHCYNKNMELVDRMDQNVAKYRIDIQMKE